MIQIYDEFFPRELQEEILNKLMEPHWHLAGGNEQSLFWHYDDLEKQEYFNEFLYEKICTKLDKKFSKIGRIYANGQTACQGGTPHQDLDGDVTFLYYPAPFWETSMEGHLVFLQDNDGWHGDGDRIITHKPNRAILFPGRMWHYAQAPSRYFVGLRVSLAYKLWM